MTTLQKARLQGPINTRILEMEACVTEQMNAAPLIDDGGLQYILEDFSRDDLVKVRRFLSSFRLPAA